MAPSTRSSFSAVVLAGVVAGVLSGFVKLGWEVLLPPRTPDRVEPPLLMLQKLGLPVDHATFTFSGATVNWSSLAVHFAFSIGAVVVYCLLAERIPIITLGVGTAYGVAVFAVFHLVVLPALGLAPTAWDLPLDEWLSEVPGHAVWLLAAELVRRGLLRSRPTA